MTPSLAGTVLLVVIGLGFVASGLAAFRRGGAYQHGRWRPTFDLLVATAALADAGIALAGDAGRAVLWGLASLCLAGAAIVAVRGVAHRPTRK